MALVTFEDLPSTNTPLNAANLNGNFNEVIDMIPTKVSDLTNDVPYAKGLGHDNGSSTTLETFKQYVLTDDVMNDNYLTVLGFSGIRNGGILIKDKHSTTGVVSAAFINFSYGDNNLKQYIFNNGTWRELSYIFQENLGNNPNINNLHYQNGRYSLYNCSQAPSTEIGILEVLAYSPDWVIQRFSVINQTNGSITTWERSYYAGTTWSNWVQK